MRRGDRRVSTSCTFTSSNAIIPGRGARVVNGYSPTSGCAWVRAARSADFPAFGGPSSTHCPAPSRLTCPTSTRRPGPVLRGRGFVLELRELLAQVREHLLGALVLRQESDHLAQGRELLPVIGRPFESLFGVVVLGREVRGHAPRIWWAKPARQERPQGRNPARADRILTPRCFLSTASFSGIGRETCSAPPSSSTCSSASGRVAASWAGFSASPYRKRSPNA